MDFAGNCLNFTEVGTSTTEVRQDTGIWDHAYIYFDGKSAIQANISDKLVLSGSFSVSFALFPEQKGPLIDLITESDARTLFWSLYPDVYTLHVVCLFQTMVIVCCVYV